MSADHVAQPASGTRGVAPAHPARGLGALPGAVGATLALLHTIVSHPLNRDHPGRALARWFLWHLGSRIAPGPIAVPFVDSTRLLMRPGDRGLTLNHYLGLAELAEMAFALHYLRPDDLFVDVGANAGAYTVLAAGAVGALTIACEPDPDAVARLRDNVALNGIGGRVELHEAALGATLGEIAVTREHGPMNQVIAVPGRAGTFVPLTTLDAILAGRRARLVKIDVEGYEPQVLAGAAASLGDDRVDALIIEIARGWNRGVSDDSIGIALGSRWTRVRYDPLERTLVAATDPLTPGNHIFVRDPAEAQTRVRSAPSRSIRGKKL